MKKFVCTLLLASASLCAASLGVDFNETSSPNTLGNPPFTLGWQFKTVNPITVTHLGIYDSSQDGLVDRYPVGLWNSSGILLASTTVSSGTADPLVGKFRMVDIADVLLPGGQDFRIGALFTSSNDPVQFPGVVTGFVTDPNILFVSANFGFGGVLVDPTNDADTAPGYFGPNFLLTSVPEPSSIALMVSGLAALALRARSRRSR